MDYSASASLPAWEITTSTMETTMNTIMLTSLLGAVLATTAAYAGSDIRELARTGSTITVHPFVNGR